MMLKSYSPRNIVMMPFKVRSIRFMGHVSDSKASDASPPFLAREINSRDHPPSHFGRSSINERMDSES